MLNFCYSQIPYQQFDIGVGLFDRGKLMESLKWFDRAAQIADQGLLLEIASYKRDIAMDIINKTKDNLNSTSFVKSITGLVTWNVIVANFNRLSVNNTSYVN